MPLKIIDTMGAATDHFHSRVWIARIDAPGGFAALVYKCLLNEDNDGAPDCYGPLGHVPRPLDELRNATDNASHDFNAGNKNFSWHAVYNVKIADWDKGSYDLDTDARLESREHTFPAQQKAGATRGFYISTTSWTVNGSLPRWDPKRYLNARAFPYAAITPPLRNLGTRQGDLGLAIWPEKRQGQGFFFGDAGNQQKVGEVSRNLFRFFFPTAIQEGHFVTFLVFPKVAAGTIEGPELNLAVRREINKLSLPDKQELVHFLSFPHNVTGRIPQETRPSTGPMSQMEQLRDALRTPYQREYLNTMWVLDRI